MPLRAVLKLRPWNEPPPDRDGLRLRLRLGAGLRLGALRFTARRRFAMVVLPFVFTAALRVVVRFLAVRRLVVRFLVVRFFVVRFFLRGFNKRISFIPLFPPV